MTASRQSQSSDERGFTLIEILIVVAIIGILAGIAIPSMLTAFDKSKQTATATLLRAFTISLEVYSTDNQFFPITSSLTELVPMLTPYADGLRKTDFWNFPLAYTSDGTYYTLECYGKDGVDGLEVTPATRYAFTLDLQVVNGSITGGIE